jgi:RNA polymerase sigma-54 factor
MLRQSLQQKLLQKLSPQQIQLMKLLQVPTVALEQRIKEEIEINPALEEGEEGDDEEFKNEEEDATNDGEEKEAADEDYPEKEQEKERDDDFDINDYIQDEDLPYYKTAVNNSSADDERTEIPISVSSSFQDSLLSQLGLCDLDDHQYLIAQQLIGSLDDDGYLRRDINAILDDLAFAQNVHSTKEELLELLKVIQTFDPPGVGARNLQECLLLQLERKADDTPASRLAITIIKKYMDEFSKKHYDKIEKQLYLQENELKDAIHEILKLNPRPGNTNAEGTKSVQHIIPDFIITNSDGALEVTLNSRNAPDLRISRSYSEILDTYSKDRKKDKSAKDAMMFIKQKVDAARWFIDAIQQRQYTLLKTMTAIMNYQKEYFLDGDETKLKPMILKDIADIVQMDISTVSRVANSKYVQTPYGTFLIKTFFSEALSTDSGEEVSSREVKKILSDAIGSEDKHHPLPDEKLVVMLKEKGYNIARRTIAKYREQLNIPVARLRKEI